MGSLSLDLVIFIFAMTTIWVRGKPVGARLDDVGWEGWHVIVLVPVPALSRDCAVSGSQQALCHQVLEEHQLLLLFFLSCSLILKSFCSLHTLIPLHTPPTLDVC